LSWKKHTVFDLKMLFDCSCTVILLYYVGSVVEIFENIAKYENVKLWNILIKISLLSRNLIIAINDYLLNILIKIF